jgi:hypothetical protein
MNRLGRAGLEMQERGAVWVAGLFALALSLSLLTRSLSF